MNWNVELKVSGSIFSEQVRAENSNDAIRVALARNPNADVVSAHPRF